MSRFSLHGYAILSQNDCLADAQGVFPDALKNEADWAYFQAGLDRAVVTLLGRRSDAASPNPHKRLRLVMTRQVLGLEWRNGAAWWNPAGMPLQEALAAIAPGGGQICVAGGQEVYDLVGLANFDAFHLARNGACQIEGGSLAFAACKRGFSADEALASAGMVAGPTSWLDEPARVSLCVWTKSLALR